MLPQGALKRGLTWSAGITTSPLDIWTLSRTQALMDIFPRPVIPSLASATSSYPAGRTSPGDIRRSTTTRTLHWKEPQPRVS